MSGNLPDSPEVPKAGLETGAPPVQPEVLQLDPGATGLIEELSDPAVPPVDIIRDAAQNYPDEDLSSEQQEIVDQAAADASATIDRSDPLTDSPDKPPALIDPDIDLGPSRRRDFEGAYATGGKSRMASDQLMKTHIKETQIYEPDDTPDVPVSDQEVAEGFRNAAEAKNPLEPQLTDKEFATALLDERKQLEAVAPEDPRYDDAQNRIRRIDGYRAFVFSDRDKLGTFSRDEALPRLRVSMERGRMSNPAEDGMKDGSVTEEVVDGSENVPALASETTVQVEAPANSGEQPVHVEPISDEKLKAELAYLKAESRHDRSHPYAARIKAINSFLRIQAAKSPTISGLPKEEAVRQWREELTKGAVEVPRPESLDDTTSLTAAASSEQSLPSGEKQLDDRGPDSATGSGSTGEDSALKTVLGRLDAAAGIEDDENAMWEAKEAEEEARLQAEEQASTEGEQAEDLQNETPEDKINNLQARIREVKRSAVPEDQTTEKIRLHRDRRALLDDTHAELNRLRHDSDLDEASLLILEDRLNSVLQLDSTKEAFALRQPGFFYMENLAPEKARLEEELKANPDNTAASHRLAQINMFANEEISKPDSTRKAPFMDELRKELVTPYDFESTPAREVTSDAPNEADGTQTLDSDAQAIAEKRAELITRIKEAQVELRPKDDSEEIDPLTKAKLDAIGFRLVSLEGTTISGDDANRILSRQGYNVDSILQADSKDEIDAVLYPSTFRRNLNAEIPKLEELVLQDPTNTAAAERLTRIKTWDGTNIDPRSSKEAEQMDAERKYLSQRFDYGDTPEDDEVAAAGEGAAASEATPEGAAGSSPEAAAEATRIAELKSENIRKLQEARDSLLPDGDLTELDGLDKAKLDELSESLQLWEDVTDPMQIQNWAKNYAYEANSILQADSIEEVEAIRYPFDFDISLGIEARRLEYLIASDPLNRAAIDRLAMIHNFDSLSPETQVQADAIDFFRKELLIPFDFDSDSGATDDEVFAPRWKSTRDDEVDAPEPTPSSPGRLTRLKDKAVNFLRPPGAKKAAGATGSAIPAEDAAAVPDRAPARSTSAAIPPTAPTGAVLADRLPINENTVNFRPGSVPGAAEPVGAVPDRSPARAAAAPAGPDTARPTDSEPAPAPAPATAEQRLKDIMKTPGGKLSRVQALEASKLIAAKERAIKYDRKGAAGRTSQEDREFRALNVEFATAIEADRAARESAIEPLYSDDQKELKELRDLRDSGNMPNEEGPITRLAELEASEARFQELSAKDKLNSKEQDELDEMGDTWKDPVVKAKEKEILDLADTSLESSSDFANFAEKLQEYALSKHGRFHPALEIGVRMAVEDYFNRKDSGMTLPEKEAMGRIQKLLKGMQQEITTIMTYKQSIEHQFEKQKELKDQIEVSNKLIEGEIGNDDVAKQEAASKHIQLLANMASTNAAIRVTHRRAEDANFNFMRKNREVKKELGLDGFKDFRLGVVDDLKSIYKFASRNFGLETQPTFSINNPNVKR